MSTNNIEEILKNKGVGKVNLPDHGHKKRKRRRLYDTEPEVSNLDDDLVNSGSIVTSEVNQENLEKKIETKVVSAQIEKPVKAEIKKIKKVSVSEKSKNLRRTDKNGFEDARKVAVGKPTKNFTSIPNEILEKVLCSNFSAGEIKMVLLIARKTLGWQEKIAFFTRKVFVEEGGINPNSIDRHRNTLLANKVIGEVKGAANKKGYYLIAEFFGIAQKEDKNQNSSSPKGFEEIFQSLKSIKIKNSELEELERLRNEGHADKLLFTLAKDLLDKGDLKGASVSKPFAYLNSGAFDAILSRMEGKRSDGINTSLIWEVLSQYDSKIQLPNEVKEKLSEKDLEWIDKHGGRHHLAMQNEDFIKSQLGIKQ